MKKITNWWNRESDFYSSLLSDEQYDVKMTNGEATIMIVVSALFCILLMTPIFG